MFFSGNFISDIMLNSTKADCALLNAGTLRSDMIHCQGAFKTKDLVSILPFGGSVGVLEVTGMCIIIGHLYLINGTLVNCKMSLQNTYY